LKQAITLRHLLMMASGLDCRDSYKYNFEGMAPMRRSPDWVEHVLSIPMREAPGTRFEYCNGVSYLLAAILQTATGQNALNFARENLFTPMGIAEVSWPLSPQLVNLGWGEMRLTSHDMAKFGFLYLNQGKWQDRQLVPGTWVAASTRPQIDAGTMSESYGYQWWVDYGGYYMALGYGGQLIFVEPDKNLVAVFTSTLPGRSFFAPEAIFFDYIIPAAGSDRPLPENVEGAARLASMIGQLADPRPAAPKVLPDIAAEVSGRTISFQPNDLFFKTYVIYFEPGENEALFELTTGYGSYGGSIGLDGVHRLSESAGELRAYKGMWENDTTFVVSFQVVGHTRKGTARIRFQSSRVDFELIDLVAGINHRLEGVFTN
jgi:CubicO group peptidase (beta-lactamase class C family)